VPGAHAQWLSGHAAAVVGRWAGRLVDRASSHRGPARGSASSARGGERASGHCFSESLSSRLRPVVGMARGNQRELARQKNMKKTQEISKGKRKEDSLTASQRKQRDSEIMQQKQKIANEKKSMQTREK
ncbi:Small EDRK-rich factor 1, partial [Lemmus lemmus]